MREVIKVKVLEDYKLELTFDNNVVKIKDMKPHLDKGVFRKLKNKKRFNAVKIRFGTICWDKEIDLCPDGLYEESEEIK